MTQKPPNRNLGRQRRLCPAASSRCPVFFVFLVWLKQGPEHQGGLKEIQNDTIMQDIVVRHITSFFSVIQKMECDKKEWKSLKVRKKLSKEATQIHKSTKRQFRSSVSFSHDKSVNRLSRNSSSGRGNFRPQAAQWLWHSLSQVRCDFETIPWQKKWCFVEFNLRLLFRLLDMF